MTDNQKRDQALYYLHVPDPDFSPEHNKQVIENSIKKFEAKRKQIYKNAVERFAERADAVTTYIKAIDRGGVDPRLDHFFTINQIRYFSGADLREKIHEGLRIIRNKNKLKKLS